MAIKVTLGSLTGADDKQRDIVTRGCTALERAINDDRFAERVKAAKFLETKFEKKDGTVVSIKPEDVMTYVLHGLERDTSKDEEIDLSIKLADLPAPVPDQPGKPGKPGTVGSTTTGKLPFKTAYWFIDGCVEDDDVISPARHFMHEWLHVAGFIHYPDNSARDDVPYILGTIVREILKEDQALVATPESERMSRLLDEAEEVVETGRQH